MGRGEIPVTKERLRRYRSLKLEETQLKNVQNGAVTRDNEKLQEFYRLRIAELQRELLAIEQAIAKLPEKERTILRDYYINGLSWEAVSDRNHYSISHVHRIHANALIALKNAADSDE